MKTAFMIAALVGFALFSIHVKRELRRDKSPLAGLQIGSQLQDFTLEDPAGSPVSLRALAAGKKLVMINFWASWCGPCRIEMPAFDSLYTSKGGEGLLIVGINEDEERVKADQYLIERPVTFPILMDPQGLLMQQFGVRALPTTVFVDAGLKIQMVQEGLQPTPEFLIDALLKAQ